MRGVISRARRCKPKVLALFNEGSSPEQFDTEEKAAAVKVKKCNFCSEGRLERERKRDLKRLSRFPTSLPALGFVSTGSSGRRLDGREPAASDGLHTVSAYGAVVHFLLFMQFRSCDSIVSKRCVPGKLVTPACALT